MRLAIPPSHYLFSRRRKTRPMVYIARFHPYDCCLTVHGQFDETDTVSHGTRLHRAASMATQSDLVDDLCRPWIPCLMTYEPQGRSILKSPSGKAHVWAHAPFQPILILRQAEDGLRRHGLRSLDTGESPGHLAHYRLHAAQAHGHPCHHQLRALHL